MDNVVPPALEKPTPSHRRQSLKTEECLINGEKIKVPLALCENKELFHALFSVDTWNSLTEQQKRHLMQFLPNFGERDIEEKSITLKRLFSGNEFRFGSNPLNDFSEKLNEGYYQTNIVRMQKMIEKARYKEYLKKQRIHYFKVLKHCLITRQKLLSSASELQVGCTLATAPRVSAHTNGKRKSEVDRISLEKRVKHRYFQELISIRKELGDSSDSSFDENYPEGFVPPPFTKKHRKQICALEESFNAEFDQPVISTLSRPDSLDLSRLVLNIDNPFNMTEDKYKEILKQYRRHRRNPQPYLRIQKNDQMEGYVANTKPLKNGKPLRKRRPRTKPAVPKTTSQKVAEIKPQLPSLDDNFAKPVDSVFCFPEMEQLETKIPIKTEELSTFATADVKPTNLLPSDETMAVKEEKAMKEEQDNAVAVLLKQDKEETKVNNFIKQEKKTSVLLFDEFDTHEDDSKPSDYLLTPDNYNVALHSLVTNETSSFKKDDPKSAALIETSNIPETETLSFDSLSIDTIAETPFTTSPSVSSGISACENTSTVARISPSVTDLDSMNVMDLGPLNVEDTEPPLSRDKTPPELMHNAHSSFFSLIREIICSTCDHRMDLRNLQKRVDTWYDNAVSPLNNWYMNESWPNLLQNAITFLAGQCPDDLLPSEYVPYVEYKSSLDIYQWIGAGRDSDAKLTVLCVTWLKNKDQVAARVVEDECLFPFVLHDEYDFKREQRAVSPASTRFPTDWVVKLSSVEEREDFRKQEKMRFANPNTPFTYRIHGYQTVVGPINMSHIQQNNAKVVKGSSLLIENRPHYVSILVLVQDAAARLPNGEGTRHDIVTLLKDSQYLFENIMNCILHGAVTHSLEKLQLESDPCVKYDSRRKVWIYMHRSRTINDFESVDICKPRAARKTPAWKPRKDTTPCSNAQSMIEGTSVFRLTKETKANARTSKLTNTIKCGDSRAVQKRQPTGVIVAHTNSNDQSRLSPANATQPVISDSNLVQSIETVATGGTSNVANVIGEIPVVTMDDIGTLNVLDNTHTVMNNSEMKMTFKIAPRATRPSIIKKSTAKTVTPITTTTLTVNAATKLNTEPKSILTGTSVLSPNTIVKLINAKNLTTDASKGKNITQISPQQIVVIKQAEEGINSSDKKHTLMLKQIQPSTNATPTHRISLHAHREMSLDPTLDLKPNPIISDAVNESPLPKSDLVEKQQKQSQKLLTVQQNEWKLESGGVSGKTQFQQKLITQQCKTLPKQMIVIKSNQVAQTPNVDEDKNASPMPKQLTSPVVILNKQQFQEQLKNSKHQIIQLSGQQLSTQQIQQMLLKQQQQALKQGNPQLSQQPQQSRQGQQPQQMVVVKPSNQQSPQQLVVIKQQTQSNQKVQPKQQHPQVIQIANSGSLVSPITTADLTKLQTATTSLPNARIQKVQTPCTPAVIQNTKIASVVGSTPTTIAVSVSKPSLPTYAVVALGQQQKVFAQNNQNVQILATGTSTVSNNQTVVIPTSSGAVTVLQQGAVQQVLLPSNFSTPGMINLKTLQGLKVIPISTQNTNSLKGPVITRIMNSNAIRPLVIQEASGTPASSSNNITQQ